KLKPDTNRFFLWGDDRAPWCRCPLCRKYSDSDQALTLENHVIVAIRAAHPGAQLAHLAYANTLPPPARVKPKPGIFLEFAPIERTDDQPLDHPSNTRLLEALESNLKLFVSRDAQAR